MGKLSKENTMIISIVTILLYFSYSFGIKKTISTYKHFKKEKQQLKTLKNSYQSLSLWKRKNGLYDSILAGNDFSSDYSFNNNLFKKINRLSIENNVEILNYSSPHHTINSQSNIYTYPIKLKGRFKDMLKMLHHIEALKIGQIQSIDFTKKRNYKTKNNYLTCDFFFQVLQKN